ncbi:MAG: type-F conjugative transfer system protein TraW [Alphaproteobacteria bacterium]|nr:type-F conjugative transfer system protein TraW [Alphaproteobacteria bacterium]NCQ67128.1 type-F conjugative transfer system protein TraW [Alphaproteobacteria bacterium]NCT07724.1 type-F conjugative transfer system protein TraW [Alphaproteobacteria bacterium]
MIKRYPFLAFLLSTSIEAKTFADIGHSFDIAEESFLTMIQRRVQQATSAGKLEGMEEDIKKRVKERVLNPLPVEGIEKTQEERSYYFDPSITVESDIRDHKGAIIHAKGTKVNPLKTFSWGIPLLLIDGSDSEQVSWALAQTGKVVLVKGSPIELYRKTGRRFYFDQGGKIIEKFQIHHVPARISQDGLNLLIQELKEIK